MLPALPLDDLIGRTFFIEGAPWRYLYDRERRRFALKRLAPSIEFERALELIASGELLWTPPERFEALRPEVEIGTVQRHIALLDAFRRSPAFADSKDWALPARIDARISESRAWLTRRALRSGEGPAS
ncbi:MAG TPA: hypothetical protein VFI52_00310 [Gemmatimonadaceae bacterium]|nr:hypothetical protein [Gemmatimonadaceae bacterium]